MSQIQPDKRTKSQILRLLDHAMHQEEKLAEKIQNLESQLAECRKRAEDPRFEITESAIPASKVSFRLDYYRTEKKGPVRGIIEHLSSRESKSFGSDDGFETIQQFVGKYLPVKARPKATPVAPPSPFLEKPQPEAAAESAVPPVTTVLGNPPTAQSVAMQPEAAAEAAAPPIATVLENAPTAQVAAEQPEAAAESAAPPINTVQETAPAVEPVAPAAALAPPENDDSRSLLSEFPAPPLAVTERLAARIRRSLSLPAEADEPAEVKDADAPKPIAIQVLTPETSANTPRRSHQFNSSVPPLTTNERLATRIRRSLSLPTSDEPEELPETTFQQPAVAQTRAVKVGGKAAVFSVIAESGDRHQAALGHQQHFQVEIPASQLHDFQGRSCHARLLAENLETGEVVRSNDSCQPSPSALRFPKRPLQLPPGGYRFTAMLGLSESPMTVFYRESRLVVVK